MSFLYVTQELYKNKSDHTAMSITYLGPDQQLHFEQRHATMIPLTVWTIIRFMGSKKEWENEIA